MKPTYFCLIYLLFIGNISSQNDQVINFMPGEFKQLILLEPTGETIDDLPEMTKISDTTAVYKTVISNIQNSSVKEFIDLYFIVQIYLQNQGVIDVIEPAYLALTKNQGGFAKFGFVINEENNLTYRKETGYVDITLASATGKLDRLMSFTQLYPHELGHVFYHLLSHEDTVSNNTKNVDMHFFSMITDFSTAFNEGFAEHLENISRTIEENEDIRSGIISDIEKIKYSSQGSIKGFERDFSFQWRLGYYKASMLNWYQRFEDYKRHEYAFNGDAQYKNASINVSDVEDQLTFRNSGVRQKKSVIRNQVQSHSTEGVISSFFTHLSTSSLADHYLDVPFYMDFIYQKDTTDLDPDKTFTPLQNQFIKYFYILHNYVVFNNSSKSQLIDFVEGYIESFPSESNELKSIYKHSIGSKYSSEIPPPIWLLVKDHNHRLLVFDPFDAINVPLYTFDLNAAEVEDLLTIKGLTRSNAEMIVEHRNQHGFFTDLQQVLDIRGLEKGVAERIIAAEFDQEYFEEALEDFEPRLTISTLVQKPMTYIFTRAFVYFMIVFSTVFLMVRKHEKPGFKRLAGLFIRYLILWLLFVLTGLISVFMVGRNIFPVLIYALVLALITLSIYRNKEDRRNRTFIILGVMSVLIVASIL